MAFRWVDHGSNCKVWYVSWRLFSQSLDPMPSLEPYYTSRHPHFSLHFISFDPTLQIKKTWKTLPPHFAWNWAKLWISLYQRKYAKCYCFRLLLYRQQCEHLQESNTVWQSYGYLDITDLRWPLVLNSFTIHVPDPHQSITFIDNSNHVSSLFLLCHSNIYIQLYHVLP